MRELAIKINKAIGEDGHIRQESFMEWTPYNVAVFHPFVDGNKRTAFILLELDNMYKITYWNTFETIFTDEDADKIILGVIEEHKEWLRILKEC